MKQVLFFFFFLSVYYMQGQSLFTGQLLNKDDKQPMPYAFVKLTETGMIQATDSLGVFSFTAPDSLKELHLEVSALGFHSSVVVKRSNKEAEKIYLKKQAFSIAEVVIKDKSAKQVVEKAIKEIPNLYASQSYVSNSFYRQYHKENGIFVRLIECQAATMFRLTPAKKTIGCKEAFAIKAFRRAYDYEQNRLAHLDHFFDLLVENPIYHQVGTVLNPSALDVYEFRFDTTGNHPTTYIINYKSEDYTRESIESGRLTIDKNTYAITKIERFNRKNKNGDYRQVLSSLFISDFITGTFTAEYEEIGGKWYLKKLLREYTSEMFYKATGMRMNTLTEAFEWYSDSVSDKVSADLVNEFSEVSNLYTCKYTYDKTAWLQPLHPFVFFNQADVYKSISRKEPIEEQFKNAGEKPVAY